MEPSSAAWKNLWQEETRNVKRLDAGPSSNPEWLAVECHVLAFEVSLGCKIQLVKIVLVEGKGGAAEKRV